MKAMTETQKNIMFIVLMLGMIVTSMTTTAINNAIPVIMNDMDLTAGTAQWLTSGFTLAAGIMIPATAFLIRRFSNKTMNLLALIAFSFKQLKGQKYLVDIRVFKHKAFSVAVLLNIGLYFVVMANATLLPLFVQDLRGMSATTYGLIILPGSVLSAVFTLLSGPFYDRHGGRQLFIAGMVAIAVGCAMRFVSTPDTSIMNIAVSWTLTSAGSGLIMMPAATMGLSGLKQEERVHGSAIMATLRQIAGAVGSALGVAVMTMATTRFVASGHPIPEYKGFSTSYIVLCLVSIAALILVIATVKKKYSLQIKSQG